MILALVLDTYMVSAFKEASAVSGTNEATFTKGINEGTFPSDLQVVCLEVTLIRN